MWCRKEWGLQQAGLMTRVVTRLLAVLLSLLSTGGIAIANPQFSPEWDQALLTLDVTRVLALARQARGVLPVDKYGATPLHQAPGLDAIDGGGDTAALTMGLLASGANVHVATQAGFTPLHMAAMQDCAGCVRALLKAGAKVQALTGLGQTPLHQSHPAMRPLLLAAGADVTVRDTMGRTPLHTVALPTPELLAVGVNAPDAMGFTPLHWAAFHGRDAAITWLLGQGANPQLRSTARYEYRDGLLAEQWATTIVYPAGQRAFDLVKARHEASKWSTGAYHRAYELLDQATPRQGLFAR